MHLLGRHVRSPAICIHFSHLGSLLAREGHPEALASVAQAQMSAPIWCRAVVPVQDDANRDQILRLAYGHQWPELYDLCNQLRFSRRNVPRQPVLMDWAEASLLNKSLSTPRQGRHCCGAIGVIPWSPN